MRLKDSIFTLLSPSERNYLRSTDLQFSIMQKDWLRNNTNTLPSAIPRLYFSDFIGVPAGLGPNDLPYSIRRCIVEISRPGTERRTLAEAPITENGIVLEDIVVPVATNEQQDDLQTIVHDLELRYARCFFTLKGKVGYATYFYIDGSCIKMECREVIGKSLSTSKVITYSKDIEFVVPKQGYVNTTKYCLFLERSHKKDPSYKYKRGFHEKSFIIHDISHREALCLGQEYIHNKEFSTNFTIITSLASAIIFRELPSYEEALRRITEFESLSCAFSTSLAIKLDSLSNKIVLLKNRWIIGEYSNNLFKLNTNSFNEELTRFNIPFEESNEDR